MKEVLLISFIKAFPDKNIVFCFTFIIYKSLTNNIYLFCWELFTLRVDNREADNIYHAKH